MKTTMRYLIKKNSIAFIILLLTVFSGFAQNGKGVFIGSLANQMPPHMSAALEVYANDKGLLIPRMDSVQRLALTPSATDNRASGLMVYDTDNKCVYVWRRGYNVNPTECWFSLCNSDMSMTPGPEGPQGPQGDTGVAGPQGPAGVDGTPGVGLVYQWHADSLCVRVDTAGSPFTCYWLGSHYQWSVSGDSLFIINAMDTVVNNLRGPQGPQGDTGVAGPHGPGLVYEWHNDSLCVRVDTLNAPFTCYWLGTNYQWSSTGDSLLVMNSMDTLISNFRGPQGPQGDTGVAGPRGPGLIYEWHNDSLCVRVDTTGSPFTCYWLGERFEWSATGDSLIVINAGDTVASNIRGPQGPIGPIGPDGKSMEYYWNASELCVRVVGDPTWTCTNLVGPTGPQGPAGTNGANGLNGAQGPIGPIGPVGATGPTGIQGIQGPQGDVGPVGCYNTNYLIKNDGTTATCSEIYEDDVYMNVGLGTSAPATKLDINGNLALRANTPAQITTDVNNFNIGAKSFIRLSSDAPHNISGIQDVSDGQIVILCNVGANNIILQHQNAGSNAANRFLFSTGADFTLGANHSLTIIYDAVTGCWRDISYR